MKSEHSLMVAIEKFKKRMSQMGHFVDYVEPKIEHMKGEKIFLWHGTSLANLHKIFKNGKIKDGQRGRNAASNTFDASQYPEDTGAEALVLLSSDPEELDIDPNDDNGDGVELGLFPKRGYGSSCTLGDNHELVAGFDITNTENQDDAIKHLQEGNFDKAYDIGVKRLY